VNIQITRRCKKCRESDTKFIKEKTTISDFVENLIIRSPDRCEYCDGELENRYVDIKQLDLLGDLEE
jgi:hypothetical protein